MRIETVLGVRQQGGLDAQERIQTLLEAKGRAAQVLRRCEPRDLGLFTQTCLEVLEGPDRVLYAAYWETAGRNFSALLEARTTQDLWPTHAAPFARMMNFEVLDMKRFEE